MKHIQSFEGFLNEQVLNEIGEGVIPFSWKKTGATKVAGWMGDMSMHDKASSIKWYGLPPLTYEFASEKATYIVKIVGEYKNYQYIPAFRKPGAPKPHEYDVVIGVAFDVIGSEKEAITNFGEQFKVISTVSAIIQEVMKELQEIQWIKVQEVIIAPKLEDSDEGKPIAQTKRGRLYLEYIKKQGNRLKGDWTAEIQKDRFVIKNGKWSGGTPGQFTQL
jgi:hypothetical protein